MKTNKITLVCYDSLVEKLIAETRLFFRVVPPSLYYLQRLVCNIERTWIRIHNTWIIKKNSKIWLYHHILAYIIILFPHFIFPPKFPKTHPIGLSPGDFQLFSVHSITQEGYLKKRLFRCNLLDLWMMNHLLLEYSLSYFGIYK